MHSTLKENLPEKMYEYSVFGINNRTVCTELTRRVKKAVVQLSLLCFVWT